MSCRHFDRNLDCDFSNKLFSELDSYVKGVELHRVHNMLEGLLISKVGPKLAEMKRAPEFDIVKVNDSILIKGNDLYSAMFLKGFIVPEGYDLFDDGQSYYTFVHGNLLIPSRRIDITMFTVCYLNHSHRIIKRSVVSEEYKQKVLTLCM